MMNNEYDEFVSDDDDIYFDEIVYEYGENSPTRFTIVQCELYNIETHGTPNNNSNVIHHYITMSRFKELNMDIINYISEVKPEIAECFYLPDGECISIIKTFWIKLIQRAWKKIYKKRQDILKNRCSIQSLKYREIHGKWPSYCLHYPSIKCMLSV